MNIYKLVFTDKTQAIAELLAKGIYVQQEIDGETTLVYGEGVQAIVEIGVLYDDQEVPQPLPGYCYDIMCVQDVDFSIFIVEPVNPKHAFAGYSIKEETIEIQP
jgi:hypothetical protein